MKLCTSDHWGEGGQGTVVHRCGAACGGRWSGSGQTPPVTSRPALLLVVLDGDDEEDEQGEALDHSQQEEVVVQRAVVDVT